jgi:hypothetical protein
VHLAADPIRITAERPEGSPAMKQQTAQRNNYGRKWNKWLGIYVAAGAAVYLVVYFAFFFHHGAGGY